MWTIFEVFIDLLQYFFCFMFWFFGREACGILAPRPGIEPAPPALKVEVLTTGPTRKSHHMGLKPSSNFHRTYNVNNKKFQVSYS